jgi:filamentous hemagglutinin family protein
MLSALPQGEMVKKGNAEFSRKEKQLFIQATDKTIINFESFNIDLGEGVEFFLPHHDAVVLTRVLGNAPSSVFGTLQTNGRIFLVNPRGVYFSREAVVDVGTLIATTLDIFDQDFLEGKFAFFSKPGSQEGGIINEGSLIASPEGAIVLLASHVENRGVITADVGKVVIASVEHATFDFSGDGLISFVLENALVDLPQNQIRFDIKDAGCVVQNVLNAEGFIEGTSLVEEEGVIHLRALSKIEAKEIALVASQVKIEGEISALQDLSIEGTTAVILRDAEKAPLKIGALRDFTLNSPIIDILAWQNPATQIFSGRDMTLVSGNPISADAHFFVGGDFSLLMPDGGFADFHSLFDPIITSSGSVSFNTYNGPSLKVEAGGNITCTGDITITGPDSLACMPSGCMNDPDCSILTTQPALILIAGQMPASPTCNIVPQTVGSTTFSSVPGTGSTITIGGTISGSPSDLTTLILTGNVVLSAPTTIASGTGMTINGTIDGNFQLILQGGSGTITVTGDMGSHIPLGNVTINSISGIAPYPDLMIAAVTASNFATECSTVSTGSLTITSVLNINSGIASSPVTINGSIQGSSVFATASTLTVDGNISGGTMNLTSLIEVSITGAISISSGNCTIQSPLFYLGGDVNNKNFSFPSSGSNFVVTNNVTINTTPSGAITFGGTINGDGSLRNLTLNAGTGGVTITGDVGNISALNLFSVSGGAIILGGNLFNAQSQIYTGNSFNFSAPGLVTLESSLGGIVFNTGTIQVTGGANLFVETNGGNFVFPSLTSTPSESLDILAGNGIVTLGQISMINSLLVYGGQILLNGAISCNDLSFSSNTSIGNLGAPFTITTASNAFFNALLGSVGSISNPINVNVGTLVFAGAPQLTAAFTGTTLDNSIHGFPNNPPCPIVFNGVYLVTCPVVSFPKIPARDFYVPGIYSQYNSLASDVYFLPEIVDASYVSLRNAPLSWTLQHFEKKPLFKQILKTKEKANYRI